MKYTLNTITAVVVVGSTLITSAVHAEDMKPKMEGGMTNSTTGSAPAPRDDAAYWTQKKLEMQQKSTEMRKQRVQELQSK